MSRPCPNGASDVGKPGPAAVVILKAIERRLATIVLDDASIQSVSVTVYMRSGGGWPRSVVTRVETADDPGP